MSKYVKNYNLKDFERSDDIDDITVKAVLSKLGVEKLPTIKKLTQWFSAGKVSGRKYLNQKDIIRAYLANVFLICIKRSGNKDPVNGILDLPRSIISIKETDPKGLPWLDKTFMLAQFKFKNYKKVGCVALRYFNSDVSKVFSYTAVAFKLNVGSRKVNATFNMNPRDFKNIVLEFNKKYGYNLQDVVDIKFESLVVVVKFDHNNAVYLREFLFYCLASGELAKYCSKYLETQPEINKERYRKGYSFNIHKTKEYIEDLERDRKEFRQKRKESIKGIKDENIGDWSDV